MAGWMVGVDAGGTFTDLIAVEPSRGEVSFAKVASVPSDPSQAVMNALEVVFGQGIAPGDVAFFAHGTTVATNAILEGKGATTGLLITRGFRAVYEARGWSQPSGSDLIDPFYRKPPMLVPQRLTEEITERVNFRGEVLTPLDEVEVRAGAKRLVARGVGSIAVCYLFSFLHPAHEQRTAEIVADEAPGIRVAVSSSVLPVLREYNRLSTTVIDAYVGPSVETYLTRLAERLRARGVTTPQLFVMQSNGGLVRLATGAKQASGLLLSGPAAGLIAAGALGQRTHADHVLTFDMGGTSADIGVIVDGRVGEAAGGRIAGQDVGVPMLKVRTLGAGGGTIARIGKDGLLKVGPDSAGAMPGPACYGRGGEEPTVTDANLVLGALGGAALAGSLTLDAARARHAIESRIAKPLGLNVVAAAAGIIRIVDNQMAIDLRLALQEQGQDPRHFALMAFGGAGPLHAAALARMVGISRVLVPTRPGLNCAIGLLQTAVRRTYLGSAVGRLSQYPAERINAVFAGLEERARVDSAGDGFARDALRLRHQVEMRYPQQGYQLAVDCPHPFADADRSRLKAAYDALHRQTYGQAAETEDAEIVTFRLQAEIEVPRYEIAGLAARDGDAARARKGERQVFDIARDMFVTAGLYDRDRLAPGDMIEGPAIIDQFDATTVVLAGQTLRVDPSGTLVIETGAAAQQ
jgi:N-methylhydantoinase A